MKWWAVFAAIATPDPLSGFCMQHSRMQQGGYGHRFRCRPKRCCFAADSRERRKCNGFESAHLKLGHPPLTKKIGVMNAKPTTRIFP